MRALDLFCCAGGVSVGLAQAGFDVTAVDIRRQPRHRGGQFIQSDAMTFSLEGYDFIWASPPCQGYSITKAIHGSSDWYPKLIEPVRKRLKASGIPYVIENVEQARRHMVDPIMLCGLMFNLRVLRHRLFEAGNGLTLWVPDHSTHPYHPGGLTNSCRGYSKGFPYVTVAGNNYNRAEGAAAMGGVDWMNRKELSQAIPPVYAQFIGAQAVSYINDRKRR